MPTIQAFRGWGELTWMPSLDTTLLLPDLRVLIWKSGSRSTSRQPGPARLLVIVMFVNSLARSLVASERLFECASNRLFWPRRVRSRHRSGCVCSPRAIEDSEPGRDTHTGQWFIWCTLSSLYSESPGVLIHRSGYLRLSSLSVGQNWDIKSSWPNAIRELNLDEDS